MNQPPSVGYSGFGWSIAFRDTRLGFAAAARRCRTSLDTTATLAWLSVVHAGTMRLLCVERGRMASRAVAQGWRPSCGPWHGHSVVVWI